MASVEIRQVEKRYVGFHALHDVNFIIADKEFVVLVGPSGCGKSTLLRMIAGLETISSGEIAIGGDVVNDRPARERDIAMVFQNYALYPHKSVYENMAFSLRLRGTPKDQIDKQVREAATILKLESLLDRKPKQLSGGQRQRVAMGRAIVRNPKVFLFDEPLSNLDAKLRVSMRTEIRSLHQRLGATTVYVTHDQIEAMTMADRIVVMNQGRIEQIGSPLELYDHPANLFVAGFIGSPAMNFIDGKVSRKGDWQSIDVAGNRLDAPGNLAAADGTEIVMGIRPEHITIGANESQLTAEVEVVEPTGPHLLVSLYVHGSMITAYADKHAALAPGQSVPVRLDPAGIHIFDKQTERRIS